MLPVDQWLGFSRGPRIVAYTLVGVAVLALLGTQRPAHAVVAAAAYFLCFPWALHGWIRRRADRWLGAQVAENGLTGFVTAWVAAPWVTGVGIVACLLMANAALGGRAVFVRALAVLVAGLTAGFAASGGRGFASSSFVCDAVGGILIVWFGALVGFRGFQQAIRLAQAKEDLARKSRALEALSVRLSTYLPPQLRWVDERRHGGTERRWLTVLFVDIGGFTRLTEELAPADLRELLNQYLQAMTAVAREHGGTVDKFIGDAVMVFFGDPQSRGRENDALACTRMALAMRECFVALRECWLARWPDAQISIRIGLDSGPCLVGDFGSRERLDYTAVGRTVNLASRLEQAADSQQILMSRGTFELVSAQLACEFVARIRVKGIAEPIETFQCLGPCSHRIA